MPQYWPYKPECQVNSGSAKKIWILILIASKHTWQHNKSCTLCYDIFSWTTLRVCECSIVCIRASLIMSRHGSAHMFLYLHVCVLVCVCVFGLKRRPNVLSCVTQSWSSLSFLPGPVLVFRAPPEGPLARWERCWRRPGPAVLLPSPSTGCQAQRVPLASQAWRWGCLHSQRRVWTGQGVATSCWTHTCRKA